MEKIEVNLRKDLVFTKEYRPFIGEIYSKGVFFLGSFLRIDNENDFGIKIYIFTAKALSFEFVRQDTANEFYLNNYGKKLTPVICDINVYYVTKDAVFEENILNLKIDKNSNSSEELEIPGIGFICLKIVSNNKNLKHIELKVYTLKGVEIKKRMCLNRIDKIKN